MEEIDKIINSESGKKLGLKSRADFITRAVTGLLEEVSPRFKHLNMMEDNVKIVDFDKNKIATVYFRNGGHVHCDICDSENCEHIDYALEQPDIQKALEEHDWKRKKPPKTL